MTINNKHIAQEKIKKIKCIVCYVVTDNYPAINDTRPTIIITTIATYNSQIANAGNSRKIIKKIIARPISDPPLACCVSTIFSPPKILTL